MAIDWKKFGSMVDSKELADEIKNAPDQSYDDVPDGDYIVRIEKMEVKETKAGDKLMLAVQCRITDDPDNGKQHNRMIFFNRVICGNRATDTWNDGRAIKSAITWLQKLDTEAFPKDADYKFRDLETFAEDVLDAFQELDKQVELSVTYKAKDFNPIKINEVYDL